MELFYTITSPLQKKKLSALLLTTALCFASIVLASAQPNTIVANLSRMPVSCFGASDGTASLAPTGGTTPYSLLWSTGETTSSISGLAAGPYSYTITDATGMTKTGGFSILTPGPILANASSTPIVGCGPTAFGTAVVNPTGGTPPYDIQWSNGVSGTTITSLSPGAFGYTITDNNGCKKEGGLSILGPGPIVPQVTVNHISCFGFGDGSASLNPFGGQPPYTFEWSNGATTSSISGLEPGPYAYTITDATECEKTGEFSIVTPWPIVPNLVVENSGCLGGGSASLMPFEGVPPYTYEWSTGSTDSLVTGLTPGTYGYTITDINGCTDSGSFEIGDQEEIVFCLITTVIAPTEGGTNGQLKVEATGGTGPYTFEWSNGATGMTASGLSEGTYSVTTTDANGCLGFCSIGLLPSPCVNVTYGGLIGFDQELCGPGNDPAPLVSLDLPSGGSGTLEYLWMFSTDPGPFNPNTWQIIPGATGSNYDPGPIYETTYFIRCVRRDECISYIESNMVTIVVGDDAIADISGPQWLCQQMDATYTATTATPDAQVSWQFFGPLYPVGSTTGHSVNVHSGNLGTALIILTVTENGCTASRQMRVTVSTPPNLCDQNNFLQSEFSDAEVITAYPNPTSDQLTINMGADHHEGGYLQLRSANGQMLTQMNIEKDRAMINLDLTKYPSGMYFVKVVEHTGNTETFKIQLIR